MLDISYICIREVLWDRTGGNAYSVTPLKLQLRTGDATVGSCRIVVVLLVIFTPPGSPVTNTWTNRVADVTVLVDTCPG